MVSRSLLSVCPYLLSFVTAASHHRFLDLLLLITAASASHCPPSRCSFPSLPITLRSFFVPLLLIIASARCFLSLNSSSNSCLVLDESDKSHRHNTSPLEMPRDKSRRHITFSIGDAEDTRYVLLFIIVASARCFPSLNPSSNSCLDLNKSDKSRRHITFSIRDAEGQVSPPCLILY